MKTLRHCLIAFACAALALAEPAAAETVDLGKLVADSLTAMNESRWEDALADLNTATAPLEHAEGSADQTQMAAAQWPALAAVGRSGESLGLLWDTVMELAQAANPAGLEPALNSFVDLYLVEHKLTELQDFLFAGPGSNQPKIRAVLRMAMILGFESALKAGRMNAADRIKAEALIKVLFRELNSDFKLATLAPYLLLRVGNHLATGESPRKALIYYDEIIRRKDATYQRDAIRRRSIVTAGSPEPKSGTS